MHLRRAILLVVSTAALSGSAIPAQAGPPAPTFSVSDVAFHGCAAFVSARWSGFSGRVKGVIIQFLDMDDGAALQPAGSPFPAGRSGTQEATLNPAPLATGTHTWRAAAHLISGSHILASVNSPGSVTAACEATP
jgi:hypothetical protein